ncbi:MAG: PDZ domain-containing protein [Clostridia bacterium]|nr:PDZ domain-containing protein [Clostridia bacterium]
MKKLYKILFIALLLLLAGTMPALASDDTVAPVFDQNIQTFYLIQRKDDGTVFIPENYINNITATDETDGKDITISLEYSNVDLSQDGQYQLLYTASDKSGNVSSLIIVVVVDGSGPVFDESEETTYYMNQDGIIFDSKHNIVEALPETLTAKDSMGAYTGIGVYIASDENGNIVFIDTIKDTPAVDLIKPNDILVKIDGEDVHGKTAEYAASKIKGDSSDCVNLTIIRDNEELNITVPKGIVKLYEDQTFTATADIEISSINKDKPGKIEITYTATDEAGNISEFIITVIIVDEPEEKSDKIIEDEEDEETEKLEDITTSGNPPENITIEIPEDAEVDVVESDTNEVEVESGAENVIIEE